MKDVSSKFQAEEEIESLNARLSRQVVKSKHDCPRITALGIVLILVRPRRHRHEYAAQIHAQEKVREIPLASYRRLYADAARAPEVMDLSSRILLIHYLSVHHPISEACAHVERREEKALVAEAMELKFEIERAVVAIVLVESLIFFRFYARGRKLDS